MPRCDGRGDPAIGVRTGDDRMAPANFSGPGIVAFAIVMLAAGWGMGWLARRRGDERRARLESEILGSKRRLQAIFDAITDGLIIVDRAFTIVAINKAEAAFLGRGPKELVGKPCYEAYCRGDKPCEACPAHVTFATGKPSLAPQMIMETGYHRKDVDVYTFPIKDENGETVNVIQHIRDIRDRLKLQSQIREVEQLTGIGQMAANVAHEIRNPLIAIGGFARQLDDEMDRDDPRREHTQIILEEVTRLEQILREQLTLERHLQPVLGPVDINQILVDVRKLLSHGILSARIDLKGDLQEGLPVTMGDANQLKQAFMNILTNAIHSMPGGGAIRVGTAQRGEFIVVRISDTGPGITPDVMDKLFVPFFTTRKTGSGLGLAVTRRIVENHGGEIRVESEVGKGTTFEVTIPIVRSVREAIDGEAASAGGGAAEGDGVAATTDGEAAKASPRAAKVNRGRRTRNARVRRRE